MADWFRLAPPKGKATHWREYRSALELARAWFPTEGSPQVPEELAALLDTHPLTRGADLDAGEGTPELRIAVDTRDGEPRNTDLALICPQLFRSERSEEERTRTCRLALSIEAKADESFGQRIDSAIKAAQVRRANGDNSFGDERARELVRALLGSPAVAEQAVGRLRYQLFTATVGALSFARAIGADVAVLVVHEFVHAGGQHTRESRLTANSRDLNSFIGQLLGGAHTALANGQLIGPLPVVGNSDLPSSIPLLIGKTRRLLP